MSKYRQKGEDTVKENLPDPETERMCKVRRMEGLKRNGHRVYLFCFFRAEHAINMSLMFSTGPNINNSM